MSNYIKNKKETKVLVENWRNLLNGKPLKEEQVIEEIDKKSVLLGLGLLASTITGCATSGVKKLNNLNNSEISQTKSPEQNSVVDQIIDMLYSINGISRKNVEITASKTPKKGIWKFKMKDAYDSSHVYIDLNYFTLDTLDSLKSELNSNFNSISDVARHLRRLDREIKTDSSASSRNASHQYNVDSTGDLGESDSTKKYDMQEIIELLLEIPDTKVENWFEQYKMSKSYNRMLSLQKDIVINRLKEEGNHNHIFVRAGKKRLSMLDDIREKDINSQDLLDYIESINQNY